MLVWAIGCAVVGFQWLRHEHDRMNYPKPRTKDYRRLQEMLDSDFPGVRVKRVVFIDADADGMGAVVALPPKHGELPGRTVEGDGVGYLFERRLGNVWIWWAGSVGEAKNIREKWLARQVR